MVETLRSHWRDVCKLATGSSQSVFEQPQHEYTRSSSKLLCIQAISKGRDLLISVRSALLTNYGFEAALHTTSLLNCFKHKSDNQAVDGVSLELYSGEFWD